MALIKSDRVKETSTSTGNGTFSLAGAATGYRTFASVCIVGDTFFYGISNQTSGEWETGLGTYSATNTLTRTTVHASSNSGAIVTFGAGTKEVFLTASARYLERIVDNELFTSVGSSTSVVAVNDGPQPQLDLAFSADKTLTARYGPTPSFSRASTGTVTNSSGVLTSAAVNEPRFDHVLENGVWVSKGLLIEEQRTNLCLQSNVTNTTWTSYRATCTTNSISSPDGTINASLIVEGSFNDVHYHRQNLSISSGTYTVSVYAKAKERYIVSFGGAATGRKYFNLQTGTVGSTAFGSPASTSITPVGNGWYRLSVTGPSYAGGLGEHIQLILANNIENETYSGDGTSGAYFWGAQVEAGSFPTSYIPTVATSVVRSADVCQITGTDFSSFWNASEGSFACEVNPLGGNTVANQGIVTANDGTFSNVLGQIRNLQNTNGDYGAFCRASGTTTMSIVRAAGSTQVGVTFRAATGFKANDCADSMNGGAVITDSTVTLPTVNRLTIGDFHTGANTILNGHIARLRYFNTRLANQTLVQLSGGINNLVYKSITGSGNATVTNGYTNINVSVPNPLPVANGGTGGTTAVSGAVNLIKSAPNDGAEYTLKSKQISGSPSFYWVDSTGYAPTLDLLFAADKTLTAYTGPTPSFSRASSGTYFNASGVLKTAAYNLINYSQDFENAYWTNSNVRVYSNSELAPDGTLTADKIANSQTTGFHSINKTTGISITGPLTASIYVKAAGVTSFGFEIVDNFRAIINLIDGSVVSNTLSSSTVTVTNAGNGWWRVAYSYTSNINRVIFYPNGVTSFTGDGVSGVIMWGLQIENSPVANDYVRTTESAASTPRFNHVYNGSSWVSKGLLIEEQRTNLFNNSSNLYTGWTVSGFTTDSNKTLAPDSLTLVDKLIPETGNTDAKTYKVTSITNGLSYSYSVYIKKSQLYRARLQFYDGGFYNTIFDVNSGTIISTTGGLTSEISNVGNGWYRCTVKRVSALTGSGFFYVLPENATPGDGTSGFYAWGAQLEAGEFPTSYIPTTTAAVTRSADVCQITGTDFSGFWNASEGSLVVQYDRHNVPTSNGVLFAASKVSLPLQNLIYNFASSGNENLSVYNGNIDQATFAIGSIPSAGTPAKIGFCYKVNDFAGTLNGSAVVTDTSGSVTAVEQIGIGYIHGTTANFNGHITRLRYYPARLPNATLQTLST
jgi:hypothetical protein